MKITQVEIARELGLDVSSVNKILNRRQGPKFKKETIARVFKVAKKKGYNFDRANKGNLAGKVERLEAALRKLVPEVLTPVEIAARQNVSVADAVEIKQLAWDSKLSA